MLSEKIKKKELYTAICAYGDELIPGKDYQGLFVYCDTLSGISVNDRECVEKLKKTTIHCIARLNASEVLVSDINREFFVILKEGYACFNGFIYTLNATVVAAFDRYVKIDGEVHEMPYPTEELIKEKIAGIKSNKCGPIAAMARYQKRSYLELVLQGLALEKEQIEEAKGNDICNV